MNGILYILCCHYLNMIDGWIPYPARKIADQTGLNLTAARKGLRQLKEQGYVDTTCVYLNNNTPSFPYRGWTITEKAFETDEYKKAVKEEKQLVKKVFGDTTEGEWE